MPTIRLKMNNTAAMRIKLRNLSDNTRKEITAIVDRRGMMGEGDMKTSAPWSDITGAARNGLSATMEHSGGGHKITFAHGVHYGIWLEVKNSGRYEIIMPTVRKTGAAIMQDLDHLFGKI